MENFFFFQFFLLFRFLLNSWNQRGRGDRRFPSTSWAVSTGESGCTVRTQCEVSRDSTVTTWRYWYHCRLLFRVTTEFTFKMAPMSLCIDPVFPLRLLGVVVEVPVYRVSRYSRQKRDSGFLGQVGRRSTHHWTLFFLQTFTCHQYCLI